MITLEQLGLSILKYSFIKLIVDEEPNINMNDIVEHFNNYTEVDVINATKQLIKDEYLIGMDFTDSTPDYQILINSLSEKGLEKLNVR